ncbi:DUF968 domain-containing protein [Mesorhizobium sp. B2-2-4]|uniref:DUF968 domain-containing protein n=1 Tax=unclassified Mesorhizobium TaxID=325217 RepID=UPI001127FDBB|nr:MULTISPECIES: DUF968 domain-containing protein [unclassified Mesorhizobium]TPM53234.1 DUF968 domain-containing protein [Mesorhizobium sp. B2-2-4]TPM62124.1 DUF968 domain-containing protein [Mesorhizobium sp. B2-2-1]TPN68495.1 DUF968 domain-containing protein [Mesorhizobium sp. B1-1-3]
MAGFAIKRPPTAFSTSPAKGRRRPRQEDDAHLKWIRTLPCIVTGGRPVEAAHIRYADPAYGKREVGGAEKPDDRWTVPLSAALHREQHSQAERAFWEGHAIDPCRVALALYAVSGDDEAAEIIIRSSRMP